MVGVAWIYLRSLEQGDEEDRKEGRMFLRDAQLDYPIMRDTSQTAIHPKRPSVLCSVANCCH